MIELYVIISGKPREKDFQIYCGEVVVNHKEIMHFSPNIECIRRFRSKEEAIKQIDIIKTKLSDKEYYSNANIPYPVKELNVFRFDDLLTLFGLK